MPLRPPQLGGEQCGAGRPGRGAAGQRGPTLEASSKLLASFGSVLKSFGQLPAQVAMLAVALGLFVGATVLEPALTYSGGSPSQGRGLGCAANPRRAE